MSLWKELLNPKPIPETKINLEDLNRAWDWIFERDSLGNYCRAMIALKIVRNNAKILHKQGFVVNCIQISAVSLWNRLKAPTARIGVPQRKIEIKAVSVTVPRRPS